MIAIADSGTTKATWLFIDNAGKTYIHKTTGFNPYFQSSENILESIKAELLPKLTFNDTIHKVVFYVAGCEQTTKKEVVASALKQAFDEAKIEVQHDLLAAARALLGTNAGIACIAGTGSNTCFYDGKNIVQNVQSLGLFMGDEGSGGYKGKLLLKAYTRLALPQHLHEKFEAKYTDRTADILDNVYTKPFPSRYMASFMPFILENIEEPFIQQLVYQSFADQFDNCISRYANHKEVEIGFVGSVAYLLRGILAKVLQDKGAKLGAVVRDPIEGLAEYHVLNGLLD